MFGRKVTKQDDGSKVVDTKRKTTTKHANGELTIQHKKSGRTERWVFTSEDDA